MRIRDYSAENKRVRDNFKRMEVKLDKDLAAELQAALELDGIDFTTFVRDRVGKYIRSQKQQRRLKEK